MSKTKLKLQWLQKIWHRTFCPWGWYAGDNIFNWRYKFCTWLLNKLKPKSEAKK